MSSDQYGPKKRKPISGQYQWTERRKALATSLLGTAPVEQVAIQLGLSKEKLISACSRFGWSYAFKLKKPFRLTTDQKNTIKRMSGIYTVAEISEKTGIPKQTIRGFASYKGFSVRANSEKSVHTSIPNSDINLMRDLHDADVNCAEISRKFGISHAYAWQVCTYRSRTDVI